MPRIIRMLPQDQFRVVKVIRVVGPKWNFFTGYLIYKRILTPTYNKNTPDEIDTIIFNTIKEKYPEASLELNADILFNVQLEDIEKSYLGGTSIDFEIRFFPIITFEEAPFLANKLFDDYLFKFKLNLFLGPASEKIELIQRYYIAYLDHKKYDELDNAYNSFDFD